MGKVHPIFIPGSLWLISEVQSWEKGAANNEKNRFPFWYSYFQPGKGREAVVKSFAELDVS